VETRGVYIQDVIFPAQLVEVLTAREIANQQQQTFQAEKSAQEKRQDMEAAKGRADMQTDLARASVGVEIARNKASGVQAEADGESYRLEKVGRASAVQTEAEGLAIAKGLEAQQLAVGKNQTALINAVRELAAGAQRFMPENLALNLGEGGLGASLNALVPLAMQRLSGGAGEPSAEVPPTARRTRSPAVRANGADPTPIPPAGS
jgi:hypothetical protein